MPDLIVTVPADVATEVLVALEFYRAHLDRARQEIPYPDDQRIIAACNRIADVAERVRAAAAARDFHE